ncbi:hypothetical protein LOTGIDRAFT_208992 [Lottia gigantea]|uniref:Uncharacterized protein n=1 Tax=Lottia gigantea TaxID=225164 RepID=V4ASM7_LOTGI|nr:hypothetical protein LOTGIDRAFT_208992 [Lottia gigantea]ESO97835.1 hypothetical protein LOTGIDRAFT_208992 [Lottia gigantea]
MAERLDGRSTLGNTSFPSSVGSSSGSEGYDHLQRVEGYDYEFVPPPDSKYECVICLLVLREPQQTKCGHRFCKVCIIKWLRESNKTCPVDNAKIVESDLFADNFAKREIQNFNVRCPNKSQGCEKIVMLNLIQKHIEDCPFGLIPCSNNCSDILLRRDLNHHLSSVCCYRQITCHSCSRRLTYNDLQKHEFDCPEIIVVCEKCDKQLLRKWKQHHENTECLKTVVNCMFQPLGCPQQMERQTMEEHMEKGLSDHMKMLCSEVVQISRCLGLPTGQNYNPTDNGSISDFQSLKKENNLRDSSLAEHGQEISQLNDKFREYERINRDLKQRVKYLESCIDERDGRSCNGIYYWKIKDYSKLRREAQLGNMPAIHSPPFYSSFYGYKLCVRVNLNGVDSAKGSFLSIFIHFLQGDFDDLLDWPFAGRIILSVIDQNSTADYRSHIVETLIAKPTLAAFQKPTTTRNHKGFGYMEFVPLHVLDKGQFLKNDTLIIKAHVIPNS